MRRQNLNTPPRSDKPKKSDNIKKIIQNLKDLETNVMLLDQKLKAKENVDGSFVTLMGLKRRSMKYIEKLKMILKAQNVEH